MSRSAAGSVEQTVEGRAKQENVDVLVKPPYTPILIATLMEVGAKL